MTRSLRRRATLLMWLMLALLPLRGWAMATMDAQMLAAPASAGAPASCHEAGPDASDDDAAHAHALCSLCHAAVAPASVLPALAFDQAAGLAIEGLDSGPHDARAANLYKPPRI